MKGFLADVPLATIKSLLADAVVVIAYLNNTLTLDQALIALGVTNAGIGLLGKARADSGKGLRG